MSKRILSKEQRLANNIRAKAYYAANTDKAKATGKAWASAHPGYYIDKGRSWRAAHRDAVSEKCKAWYADNSELAKARSAAWKKANIAKIRADYVVNATAVKAQSKLWRKLNPDKIKAWLEANPNYRIDRSTKIKEQLAGRKRPTRCDICKKSGRTIHYDHDHVTGLFRGWICHNCNAALGHVKDSAKLLYKLADYLDAHKSKPKADKQLVAAQKAYAAAQKKYEATKVMKTKEKKK